MRKAGRQDSPTHAGRQQCLAFTISDVVPIASVGKVRVHGEIWTAESEEPLEVGDVVRVRTVEHLRLRVGPV
ncbi:MAG: NfeD family protein [Deltaproteobacteria bacterium]|nr:NfeD family protein [Deltaproteobacteria bacterium]